MARSTSTTATNSTDATLLLADVAVVLDQAGNLEDVDFSKDDRSAIERVFNEGCYHDQGPEDLHYAIASKAGCKDPRNKNVSASFICHGSYIFLIRN